MAQFYFQYGTMASGKSIDLLKTAYNYEEQGKQVIILANSIDDREGMGMIASRIGESREADITVQETDNLYENIEDLIIDAEAFGGIIHCILIDEAQFLTRKQVLQLANIVDDFNVPVMAYGLKNDFSNHLFEGSKALVEYADKMKEIKTICWHEHCGRKATMNLRIDDNGKPIYSGEQVEIGGNESYIPVCRKHYFIREGVS